MMLIACRLPKYGAVVFYPATIGGCVTDLSNKNHTVVYTDTFPDGVTVDMTIEEFSSIWQNALLEDELIIEFTPEEVPDVQH